jgi:cell division septal protein FtsQ
LWSIPLVKRNFSLKSSRGAFYREPAQRSPEKKRQQRVKLRRRYAGSVLKQIALRTFQVSIGLVALAILGYGGKALWNFWHASSALRVASVQFRGDIPKALRASFPLKAGDHLFEIELDNIEENLTKNFPELETLAISRQFDRALRIEGKYKDPSALYEWDGKIFGIYRDGTLFPVRQENKPGEKCPLVTGKTDLSIRSMLVRALNAWENHTPEFSGLVKRLETDNIGAVRVVLEGGVVIHWGEMNEKEFLIHAENIVKILDRFTPTKSPAVLRLVSKNRIVMDSNWTPKQK